ncbi:hypothetical protein [Scytonema hofmannii]|nr:hypothetical protein [Scytonema hofmannii]
MSIIDDDESPTLSVAAFPGELWAPNHKMVEVKVNVKVIPLGLSFSTRVI